MAVFPPFYEIPTVASTSGCCSYFVDDSSTAWNTGTPPTAPSNAPASPNSGDTAIEKKSNGVAYWKFDGAAWVISFWCPAGSTASTTDEVCVSENAPTPNTNPSNCKIWIHCNPDGSLASVSIWCDPNWNQIYPSTSITSSNRNAGDVIVFNPTVNTDCSDPITFDIPAEWFSSPTELVVDVKLHVERTLLTTSFASYAVHIGSSDIQLQPPPASGVFPTVGANYNGTTMMWNPGQPSEGWRIRFRIVFDGANIYLYTNAMDRPGDGQLVAGSFATAISAIPFTPPASGTVPLNICVFGRHRTASQDFPWPRDITVIKTRITQEA